MSTLDHKHHNYSTGKIVLKWLDPGHPKSSYHWILGQHLEVENMFVICLNDPWGEILNGSSLGTFLLLCAPQIYWTFVAFCCQLKVEICFLYSKLKYFNIFCWHLLPIENWIKWNLFQTPSALSPCNTNSRAVQTTQNLFQAGRCFGKHSWLPAIHLEFEEVWAIHPEPLFWMIWLLNHRIIDVFIDQKRSNSWLYFSINLYTPWRSIKLGDRFHHSSWAPQHCYPRTH